MKDNITPEEKLLKIIENPNVEKRKLPAKGKDAAAALLKGSFFKGFHLDKNILKGIDPRTGNKVMAGVCAIVTAFLIFDLARLNMGLGKRFEKLAGGISLSRSEVKALPVPTVELNKVLAEVKRRNIFTFVPPKAQASGPAAVQPQASAGSLKLVGILWSSKPQAMIEDSGGNKTHLLFAGDAVGEFRVKTILRDRVIMQKGEEEWELR